MKIILVEIFNSLSYFQFIFSIYVTFLRVVEAGVEDF